MVASWLTTPVKAGPHGGCVTLMGPSGPGKITLLNLPTLSRAQRRPGVAAALFRMLNSSQGKTVIMVTHDPLAADHPTRRLHVDKGLLVGPQEAVPA